MAFGVKTRRLSFGNLAGVINQVTGDASTQTWETGLSHVMFYVCTTGADAECIFDEIYLNKSDGTTTAQGSVYVDEAAPDNGEVWYCLGIGKG